MGRDGGRTGGIYCQPVLRASQFLATSPCDAWNGRSVGNPGGAGCNPSLVKNPATAATTAVRASGSTW